MSRTALLALSLSWLAAGCSSSDAGGNDCQSCPPGQTCNWQTGTCQPAPQCEPGTAGSCGANAVCSAGGTCGCQTGWFDCNGDLGLAAGNGCECDGGCSGSSCAAPSGQCSPQVAHDCDSFVAYCDAATGSCRSCPDGFYNCTGLGPCESQQPCGSAQPCDAAEKDACGGSSMFCDDGSCSACPAETYNCDGIGPCENPQACTSQQSCIVNHANDCGDEGFFCDDGTKTCKTCAAGTYNCDGTGICECDLPCDGDICQDLSKMSCVDLEIAYGNLVADAMACDPALGTPQCTHEMAGGAKCRCPIFANPANADPIRTMEAIIATFDAAGCQTGCPPMGCSNPTSATCKATSGGAGKCSW